MTSPPSVRFRSARCDAEHRLRDVGGPEVTRFFTSSADMAELILQSDFHFREAERRRLLGVDPATADDAFLRGRRYNDLVLEILSDELPAAIDQLREHLVGFGDVDYEANLVLMDATVRDQLASTDNMTVNDARGAEALLMTTLEAARRGPNGLCDHALEKMQQLAELRRGRERHNDPVSAVLATLCLIAAAALMFICAARRACGSPLLILIIATLFVFGRLGWMEAVAALSKLPVA
jgi:hypothetical protein